MIARFLQVDDGLFRGSAPSVEEVKLLSKNYGIKKIISLDYDCGMRINRICKLMNIQHIMLPLTVDTNLKPLLTLFSNNLKELLIDGGPTYIHCRAGKDRTGMLVAIYKCKYMGWSCTEALDEAEKLGFGIGLPSNIISLYKELICKACKKKHTHACTDENSADIVEESRSEFTNSLMNTVDFKSFAPFLDITRQYPYDGVYNSSYEQFPTRENYNSKPKIDLKGKDVIPQVGLYDANSGIKGLGPVDNGGGFTAT